MTPSSSGHNVRFDLSFLNAALTRHDRPTLTNPSVDTCSLARRLLRDDVPNCKLDTLASRLRLDHRPSHRALDDALATTDLLHVLIERASGLGVTGLDDLLALPTLAGTAHVAKLKLTDRLPRAPGIYVFRDVRGEVLYVGKASNLRSRVRSYFSTDSRRKIGNLLRELARIDHTVCRGALEATVLELRLIQRHAPRYNRVGRRRAAPVFVRLTDERVPAAVRRCANLHPAASPRSVRSRLRTRHWSSKPSRRSCRCAAVPVGPNAILASRRALPRSSASRRVRAPEPSIPIPTPRMSSACAGAFTTSRHCCSSHWRLACTRSRRPSASKKRRRRAIGRRVGISTVAATARQWAKARTAHGLRHSR